MKIILLSVSLVLLLVTSSSSAPPVPAATDMITVACNRSATTDPNVDFTFCMNALNDVLTQKSHRRRPLRMRAVAVLAIKAALVNATHTKAAIKRMLHSGDLTDPYVKQCVKDCLDLYSDAVDRTADSVAAVKARRFSDASTWMSAAMDAPSTCDDGFADKEGVVNPLKQNDQDMFQLTAIALNAIAFMS